MWLHMKSNFLMDCCTEKSLIVWIRLIGLKLRWRPMSTPGPLQRASTRSRSYCCSATRLLGRRECPLWQQRQVPGRRHHRPRVCPLSSPPWLCIGLPQLQSGAAGSLQCRPGCQCLGWLPLCNDWLQGVLCWGSPKLLQLQYGRFLCPNRQKPAFKEGSKSLRIPTQILGKQLLESLLLMYSNYFLSW